VSDPGATDGLVKDNSSAAKDVTFLGLLIVICAAPYISGLGFYADDWAFLSRLSLHPDQSFIGLLTYFGSIENIAPRPLQAFELVGLYKLFGLNPTPGHVVNHLVLWLGVGFLYLAARRVTGSRGFALVLAIIYVTLPHFDTTRFWLAAYQANASLMFFAASAYCLARHCDAPRWRYGWLAAALLAMSLSVLAYELFLPLLLLLPLVIWSVRGRRNATAKPQAIRDLFVQLAGIVAVVLALVAFKLHVDDGLHQWRGANFLGKVLWLYASAVRAEFVYLGALFPVHVVKLLSAHGTVLSASAGVLAGLFTATYLTLTPVSLQRNEFPLWALPIGLLVFVAGYGVLLQNFMAGFGQGTGIANRINIASAIGLALVALGLVSVLSRLLPTRQKTTILLTVLVVGVAGGTMRNATSGVAWAEAAEIADQTLAEITRIMPEPPVGSSILVYGMCPYHGPAPVYESSWDLSGRLALLYGHPGVTADILDASSTILPTGIAIYEYSYPYGDLMVVDLISGTVRRLDSRAQAENFFTSHPLDQANGCRFADGLGEPWI